MTSTAHTRNRIALYGGGFDPPHLGHDACLRVLLDRWADQVKLVPTGIPTHKQASSTPSELRMAWCQAWAQAANVRQGAGRVHVLDWEISGQLSGYTADLARRAAVTWPDAELAVAIGADQFSAFSTWYRGMEILDYAGLLVIPRGGVPIDGNSLHHLRRQGHNVEVLDTEPVVASSTAIRALKAAGDETWKRQLLPEVAAVQVAA